MSDNEDGQVGGAGEDMDPLLDIKDLYAGVQSMIQGDDQAESADDVQLTKPGLAKEPDAAEEPEKQLYEVLPEVNLAQKEGQLFGSKVGYQIPGAMAAPEV